MATGLAIAVLLATGTIVLCGWRVAVGLMAARPVSSRLREAAGLSEANVSHDFGPSDFAILESLCAATGALSDAGAIGPIRAYYGLVRGIGGLFPATASWSQKEMAMCSRYLAVRVDSQLASNVVCSNTRY